MTYPLFSLRARDLTQTRLPRSGRRLRTVRSLTIEQAARLAPEWGSIEAPGVRDEGPWNVRRF